MINLMGCKIYNSITSCSIDIDDMKQLKRTKYDESEPFIIIVNITLLQGYRGQD